MAPHSKWLTKKYVLYRSEGTRRYLSGYVINYNLGKNLVALAPVVCYSCLIASLNSMLELRAGSGATHGLLVDENENSSHIIIFSSLVSIAIPLHLCSTN